MHPRDSLITQAVRGCPEMPPILVTAPCWRVNLHEYTGAPAWAILAHAADRVERSRLTQDVAMPG